MRKQDEMEKMNMLLASRNAFAISAIVIGAYIIYSMIRGEYKGEIVIFLNIMLVSFWASKIYYTNKREGKDFFRAALPIAITVLILALITVIVIMVVR